MFKANECVQRKPLETLRQNERVSERKEKILSR